MLKTVPITKIKPDPNQPRKVFDEAHIDRLSRSLEIEGLINPIECDSNLTIITGECRYRAAKKLGWARVTVNINDSSLDEYTRLRRQMAENVHQSGTQDASHMNPIDTAKGYRRLLELKGYNFPPGGKSQGVNKGINDLSRDIGVPDETISQHLELLEEPAEVIKDILKGRPRTYYRAANLAPDHIRPLIKERIMKDGFDSRDEIQDLARLAKKDEELALIRIREEEIKRSHLTNRILNAATNLGLALEAQPIDMVDPKEGPILMKQLLWIRDKITDYVEVPNQ